MKAKELREMTVEELHDLLNELREQLFQLRLERARGSLGQPHRFRQVRRDIARVLTILREKESHERA